MGLNLVELYRELEKDKLDSIKQLHIENGVLRAIIETFPESNARQWAEYFLRLNGCLIENVTEEIEHDRKKAGQLKEL